MLFWKLISFVELITICLLILVIIQKARYDMSQEEYEDFDAVIVDKDYIRSKKRYYVTVRYKYGSITIKDRNYYYGFNLNTKVVLRIKVKRIIMVI